MKLKYALLMLAALCLLSAAVMPASALTLKTYDVNIASNGNAVVSMSYEMTWIEYIGYYLKVADPAAELKKQFDQYAPQPVTIMNSGTESMQLYVPGFALYYPNGNTATIVSPSFSFEKAEQVLKNHPVALVTSFDLSPEVTTIRFPDGSVETYYNVYGVPSSSRVIVI